VKVRVLSSFCEAAFGLKEIDRVGNPATKIIKRDVMTAPIGGTPIKFAVQEDPDGNALEPMDLPTTLTHLSR
jgi:hypothetical protein